ncbi:MAG: hypothetical protein V4657_03860 [Pseudomonadota bacterium]
MLSKGQPIPQELRRAGQPYTVPTDFHGLPLAQQLAKVAQIGGDGSKFMTDYYAERANPFQSGGAPAGPMASEQMQGFNVPIDGGPMQVPGVGMAAKKPGFFSKGGGWVDALGAFGDAFGTNGPVYAQQKQRQNELLRREQMAEQERMNRREDMQWEWQNKPREQRVNDTEEDWNYYKSVLTPEEFETWKQRKINPPQFIPDGMGGGQWANPTVAPPVSNGLPPIGTVVADPRKKGGPGSAPGNFR